jgi:hypothetical protein
LGGHSDDYVLLGRPWNTQGTTPSQPSLVPEGLMDRAAEGRGHAVTCMAQREAPGLQSCSKEAGAAACAAWHVANCGSNAAPCNAGASLWRGHQVMQAAIPPTHMLEGDAGTEQQPTCCSRATRGRVNTAEACGPSAVQTANQFHPVSCRCSVRYTCLQHSP